MSNFTISTVTPVYQGEKFLDELISRLERLRCKFDGVQGVQLIESIFVIDECEDESEALLHNIAREKPWVKVITLSKNFGQHPATTAGFLYSNGDWVATLDEDLQHDPKYIVALLSKAIDTGSDVCYANSISEVHGSYIRDKLTIVFKKMVGLVTGNKNTKYFSSFRVVRGSIARAAGAISRHESYLDIVLSWFTDRVVWLRVEMIDSRFQETKRSGYSLFSLLKHAKRMIMSSKLKVLRFGLIIGIFAFIFSLVLGAYSFTARIMNFAYVGVQGWSSLILTILFFGGLISLLVGIVLESLSDLLLAIGGKPPFFVVDRSGDKLLAELLKNVVDEDVSV